MPKNNEEDREETFAESVETDSDVEAVMTQILEGISHSIKDPKDSYEYFPPGTRPLAKNSTSITATETTELTPPTPQVVENPAKADKPALYDFPINDPAVSRIKENLRHLDSRMLLEILRRITYEKLLSTGDYASFAITRPMICAVSLLLNEKAEIAPRFRPIRKLRQFTTSDARNFSNDLQVLDIHWLSLHEATAPERQWKSMILPRMNFQLASRFVEQLKTAANKATALGLTEKAQLLLSVICSKAAADRWRSIVNGQRKVEVALNVIAESKSSRLNKSAITERCNEYVALRIGRGSPTTAAEVLPLIAGATTTVRAMQKRRDWFGSKGLATD